VELRAIVESDRAEWLRAMAASEALHAPWFPDRAAAGTPEERFDSGLSRHAAGSTWRGILVASDGRVAAWVNLNDIVRGASQYATAGWAVNAEFAGRGLATRAVWSMLDVAFAPPPLGLGLHRVACGIMPSNHRSLRVAEKCGFRREGLGVELICIHGRWEDHVLLAKLAREHRPPVQST
jgi:ribosomal-protein-alanine N-acetyltransferase